MKEMIKGGYMTLAILKWFKKWLEQQWDLKVLVAHDDPALLRLRELEKEDIVKLNVMPKVMVQVLKIVVDMYLIMRILKSLVKQMVEFGIERVRIWEHENNYAEYVWVK